MDLKDIVLTRQELDLIRARDRDKAQCLKLMDMLKKEEQIHHMFRYSNNYPYKRLGCSPACKLCEIEKLIKI